jgi:hypothetical protein
MTIVTNPPGALAYVDNYEIGTTPCSTDYTFYGTRQIRLVKDGYETLVVNQPLPPPWYQIPPLDFFSETLLPNELRDERTLSYQLTQQVLVPTDHLLARAENLRRGHVVVPAAAAAPPTGAAPETSVPAAPPVSAPQSSTIFPPPAFPPATPQQPAGQRPSEPLPSTPRVETLPQVPQPPVYADPLP